MRRYRKSSAAATGIGTVAIGIGVVPVHCSGAGDISQLTPTQAMRTDQWAVGRERGRDLAFRSVVDARWSQDSGAETLTTVRRTGSGRRSRAAIAQRQRLGRRGRMNGEQREQRTVRTAQSIPAAGQARAKTKKKRPAWPGASQSLSKTRGTNCDQPLGPAGTSATVYAREPRRTSSRNTCCCDCFTSFV